MSVLVLEVELIFVDRCFSFFFVMVLFSYDNLTGIFNHLSSFSRVEWDGVVGLGGNEVL